MSHNIKMSVYPENVNRTKVQSEWDNYVRMEDWQEGASGLPGKIRWIENIVLNSKEDAEEFINKNDNGWYDQLAVRFKDVHIKMSKKYDTLATKLKTLKNELNERNNVFYATTVKSEFVGCKNCGSKLASKYIQRTNVCPLCRADLRSQTTLSNLQRLRERIAETEKLLKEEEKNLRNKQIKNATVKWLVKIEYHT